VKDSALEVMLNVVRQLYHCPIPKVKQCLTFKENVP
jgi:hypothetical protein